MSKLPPVPDTDFIKRIAIKEVINNIYALTVERKQIQLFERELDDAEWPIGIQLEFANKIIQAERVVDDILNDYNIRRSPYCTYTQE